MDRLLIGSVVCAVVLVDEKFREGRRLIFTVGRDDFAYYTL